MITTITMCKSTKLYHIIILTAVGVMRPSSIALLVLKQTNKKMIGQMKIPQQCKLCLTPLLYDMAYTLCVCFVVVLVRTH